MIHLHGVTRKPEQRGLAWGADGRVDQRRAVPALVDRGGRAASSAVPRLRVRGVGGSPPRADRVACDGTGRCSGALISSGNSQIRDRRDDLKFFEQMGNVEIVPSTTSMTGRRSGGWRLRSPRARLRTEPPMIMSTSDLTSMRLIFCSSFQNEGESHEELEQRMWGFDFHGSSPDVVLADELGERDRELVVAAPGIGEDETRRLAPLPALDAVRAQFAAPGSSRHPSGPS